MKVWPILLGALLVLVLFAVSPALGLLACFVCIMIALLYWAAGIGA